MNFEYFQDVVLHQLINNKVFLDKSIPFIKANFFENQQRAKLFITFKKYYEKYNNIPNEASLKIALQEENMSDKEYLSCLEIAPNLYQKLDKEFDNKWLIDSTEIWCRKRAFYLAIVEGSQLLDKNIDDFSTTDIPNKMEEALGISFDTAVGLNYKEDWERRFEYMHADCERFAFDIDFFNKITKNGLPRKSLTVLMSNDTGGFKSGTMCHMGAHWALKGYNVLYISMEMSEEMIGQRIDANLLDIDLDDLEKMEYQIYKDLSEKMKTRMPGNLIIKEYPTSSAHAGNFRHLIKELKTKNNFAPDILIIDYINICASSRVKYGATNSYNYVKAIAEEIRALAVEFNCAVLSATQGNRDASGGNDIALANTSESMGLPHTVDLMIGIITNDQLYALNQIKYKQLKNRLGSKENYKEFKVGLNTARMKIFDIADNGIDGTVDLTTTGISPYMDDTIPGIGGFKF